MTTTIATPDALTRPEIEAELKEYLHTLAKPCFVAPLIRFAIEVAQQNTGPLILSLIDVIQALEKPGLAWIETFEWSYSEPVPRLSTLSTTIGATGLNTTSAKSLVFLCKIKNPGSLIAFDEFANQACQFGDENTRLIVGMESEQDRLANHKVTLLITGLEKAVR